MARIAYKQNRFNRGVVSKKLHEHDDLETYYSALSAGENFIIDGRGLLEKRPGTMFIAPTKSNGQARLIPFAYSVTQAYMLEFGGGYIRAFANYGQLMDGTDPVEVTTPYSIDNVWTLSTAQSNDVMFLADGVNAPARLIRTGSSSFILSTFETFDGPYEDINADTTQTLALSTSGSDRLLTASGHAPFTSAMVGRWVRLQTPNTDGDDNELGDEFLWDYFQITEFVSSSQVKVDSTGGDVSATSLWRLGVFYTGRWPSVVSIMNGRLILALGNRIFFSKVNDYNNFGPTALTVNGGAASTVDAQCAINVVIDNGLTQTGAIANVLWAVPMQFQLLVGTPGAMVTVQSSSLGDAITAENVVVRPQDARGAAATSPANVADSVLFAHTTGYRLQGAYYKDTSYDKLGAKDLSLPSDDLITAPIKQICWQDYPHGVVWGCLEDGRALTLTLQPEEQVQGWFPQRFGGRFVNGGVVEHAHVESVACMPSPDGTKTDVWFIIKRTIDGTTKRYVEVLRPFRRTGEDLRDAWYVDSGLRYDGNDNAGKVLALSPPVGGGPNAVWGVTTNFSSPAFEPQQKFSLFDGVRWHRGTIIAVTEDNDFTWLPAAPNAPPGRADGVRWFYDEESGQWIQPAEDALYAPKGGTYQQPLITSNIWRWSLAQDDFSGIDHLEGENVRGLLDGSPMASTAVESGAVNFESAASVATVGLPYVAFFSLLPPMQGAQAGSATEKQRPIYQNSVSVLETYGLECGTGQRNDAKRSWEYYEPTVFEPIYAEGEPPPLYTGAKTFGRDSQYNPNEPAAAVRHKEPTPCYIRSIVSRLSVSDGR